MESDKSIELLALQCQKEPENADIFFRLGTALEAAEELDGAFRSFQHVRRLDPDHCLATQAGCYLLLRFDRQAELRSWLQTSPLLPANEEFQSIYAEACLNCGDYAECIDFLEKRPELLMRNSRTAAVQVRAMVYDPAATSASLYNATTRWASLHAAVQPLFPAVYPAGSGRRLRLGFVGTRMNLHNTSTHLLNLLRHVDQAEFDLVLYADSPRVDARSKELRSAVSLWRDIYALNAKAAAEQVRADRIDILVDLHEFSNDARLQIFAYKPAPLQVHWCGNATTTGLSTMDFRITSRITDPPADNTYSSEIPLYVPCYYLYSPSPMAQNTKWSTIPPSQKNGVVTFGAIHHFAKYNPPVLNVWRQILERVPGSRLLVGRQGLDNTTAQSMMRERFKKNGIDPQRVMFEGRGDTIASLELFNRMDVVLDSFPFNGDATTSDALWMGVPLITLKGARTASRRAADQLQLCGHPEWIAETEADYIEKAVTLARLPETLAAARQTLHQEFAASPLCDHAQTAADLGRALRSAWKTACD